MDQEIEKGRIALWLSPEDLKFLTNEWRKIPETLEPHILETWARIAFFNLQESIVGKEAFALPLVILVYYLTRLIPEGIRWKICEVSSNVGLVVLVISAIYFVYDYFKSK